MQHCLVWLTLCFALGIIFANHTEFPFSFLCVCALAVLAAGIIFFRKKTAFSVIAMCGVFVIGAMFLKTRQVLPPNHITHFLWQPKNTLCAVTGLVKSQPELGLADTVFELESEELQGSDFRVTCRGIILVDVKGRVQLMYGQRVKLRGSLDGIFQGHGQKGVRYREYLARRGIFARMQVSAPGFISVVGGPVFSFTGLALSLKGTIKDAVSGKVSPVTASVINAMILGEKKDIPALLYQSMMKTGTVHILVVSGFNTNLVIGIVILFLKLIRVPRKIRFFLALPALVMYCLMTGASPPVMRATVMTIVFMAVYYFKRGADIFNACALALLVILAANPCQLFEISLQLSFACVLAVAFLYPKLKSVCGLARIKNKAANFIAEAFLVSLSAWLGTAGLIAYYFRMFSPVTVAANIIIVPLATLITFAGVALVFAAFVCPALAPFIGQTCELLVSLLVHVNFLLLKIPYASIQF